MTGFIYEPLEPYTIHQWKETLGNEFDAERWVKDFKEAGAQHLVFYDKWIDGLVFHDTKTTNFKTDRDFVSELAAACQRHELPLVFYFNAVSDGNPEFGSLGEAQEYVADLQERAAAVDAIDPSTGDG